MTATVHAHMVEASTISDPMTMQGSTENSSRASAKSDPLPGTTTSSGVNRPRITELTRASIVSVYPPLQVAHDHMTLFQRERLAFEELLPTLTPEFDGRFVAIHRGIVVDSDASRAQLVRRFFGRFGDASVYVGFVGPEVDQPVVNQLTPFAP